LNDANQISVLWAGSPAANAGLQAGEMVWSLGQDAKYKQPKAELEAGLRNLSVGQSILYVVTSEEWRKALTHSTVGRSTFNPTRRKLILTAP
jgi:hypothetical protein